MTTKKVTKPQHSARVIAKALAMFSTGSSVAEVVTKLRVPKQTASDWKKLLPEPETGQNRTKREIVENLYGEYLEETLRTLLAQLKACADPEWIKKQSAAELATLHGVFFDKSVRVYDAARAGAALREQQLLTAGPDDEEH